MTLPLPWPEPQVPDENRDNFDQVATQFPIQLANVATGIFLQLSATGTARKVGYGVAAATMLNGTSSITVAVNHGLGTTPIAVVAVMHDGSIGLGLTPICRCNNYGATTFDLTMTTAGIGAAGADTALDAGWVAIG